MKISLLTKCANAEKPWHMYNGFNTLFARNSIAAEATMALDRVHKMQNLYLFMSKDKWKEWEKNHYQSSYNLIGMCVWFVLTSMKIKTKHLMNEWEKTLVIFCENSKQKSTWCVCVMNGASERTHTWLWC